MWDLKLGMLEIAFYSNFMLINKTYVIMNFINPVLHYNFIIFQIQFSYQFIQNLTVIYGVKFLICIAFLILIRGGTPRYRYDYLTKLGWLKFISLVILIFFASMLMMFIY